MARAVLFDIDGTLIDSVDLHAQAWQQALARFGKEVRLEEVRSQIGKGGDQLLPEFLSDEDLGRFGDDLAEYRSSLYQREFLPWARPFPQARELLERLKQAGLLVGLASSCSRSELGCYLRLLGGASLIDCASTADDAERSKPFPDVFEICLERLYLSAREAIAVGDSPFDVESAARAGVPAMGVLSGGFSERVLEAAGCIAIYQDVAEILSRLGTSPLAPQLAARP